MSKIPVSVLVVIHTPDLQVLLIKRTAKTPLEQNFWQSVTGSLNDLNENPRDAAVRELFEETGLLAAEHELSDWHESFTYEIYPAWRHRYEEGVTHNVEHWFGLKVANTQIPIVLAPDEHTEFQWLPFEAAAQLCFSANNAQAIRSLTLRV
ncbi:MAG: dihydroneopterin triphosphate diphosphatase [Formosimonas sp.]